MRSLRVIPVAALAALCACSYDAEKSDLSFEITNIAQNQPVNHLDVTLTLPDGPHVYHPTFGAQSTTVIDLALPSNGQIGAFTLKVDEVDRNGTVFGTTTVIGTIPMAGPQTVPLPNAP